ncbi:uncharacterized protein ARMOST_07094 [Armillaria ostoyae]|uniref:Protein kinase domain-containing protein n=1 Tax=Armillaria ostoyae TaxID=47428 RepID=A0A284R4V3_ARMOS|nr:uncharacterized protein ARMOST_07094 [Armillaria ostoyae]
MSTTAQAQEQTFVKVVHLRPTRDDFAGPDAIYFPGACHRLYTVEVPDFPEGDKWCQHNKDTLQRQKMNGLYSLCLADRIHLPPSPSLTITLSQRLCGGIREHVTHVWTATPNDAPSTVVAKFYDPLYFRDEYDNTDPLRLAAWSAANEVRAYEKLQSLQGACIPRCLGLYGTTLPEQGGRTVYVLLLEHVTGKDLRFLCEMSDEREKIVADYLCEKHCNAIFSTVFRLVMDFISLGVAHGDLAPRNLIIKTPALRGPFCSTECCPARHEIDADDVQAVMVDFERVVFHDPKDQSLIDRYRKRFVNAVRKEYLCDWFRNMYEYPQP